MRRKYRWASIADQARRSPGVWRLHPDLVGVKVSTETIARRRTLDLMPDEGGHFEFSRKNGYTNDLGERQFDLLVRYIPKETYEPAQPS